MISVIAHDQRTPEMLEFVRRHLDVFQSRSRVATARAVVKMLERRAATR